MTEEQFDTLAQYEPNFESALKANYSRYPGREGVDTMFRIYREITNTRMNLNRTCSVCILNLVKNLGRLYFAEKTRREEEARRLEEERLKKEEPKAEPKPDKAKKTSRKKKESK